LGGAVVKVSRWGRGFEVQVHVNRVAVVGSNLRPVCRQNEPGFVTGIDHVTESQPTQRASLGLCLLDECIDVGPAARVEFQVECAGIVAEHVAEKFACTGEAVVHFRTVTRWDAVQKEFGNGPSDGCNSSNGAEKYRNAGNTAGKSELKGEGNVRRRDVQREIGLVREQLCQAGAGGEEYNAVQHQEARALEDE